MTDEPSRDPNSQAPGGCGPSAAETGPDGTGPADEALLRAIAVAQDRAAFVTLFHRYAGRVKGFLMSNGTDPGLAEEAAQEVMIALWRRAPLYDPEKASAATWIFTIARNKRIDLIRRAQRPAPDGEDPAFQPEPAACGETALARAERDRLVRAAVAALPGEQIDAVRLAFFGGLSHGAVAERLGLPLGTVKSRLRLAFGRLRGALGADFAQELYDD